jgi:hypothetical protein
MNYAEPLRQLALSPGTARLHGTSLILAPGDVIPSLSGAKDSFIVAIAESEIAPRTTTQAGAE